MPASQRGGANSDDDFEHEVAEEAGRGMFTTVGLLSRRSAIVGWRLGSCPLRVGLVLANVRFNVAVEGRPPRVGLMVEHPEWRYHPDRLFGRNDSARAKRAGGTVMERSQVMLAAMAAGGPGAQFNPVQIQKHLFLIDREIPDWVDGPHFDFKPYDYGPFDKAVYGELDSLAMENQVNIDRSAQYRRYSLTGSGIKQGMAVLADLPEPAVRFLKESARWVRALTFGRLVAAIYQDYPDMRVNSRIPEVLSRYPRAAIVHPIPSFLSGMARTFDFMGTLGGYQSGWWDNRGDASAIHGDWAAVGDDLRVAMESHLREKSA